MILQKVQGKTQQFINKTKRSWSRKRSLSNKPDLVEHCFKFKFCAQVGKSFCFNMNGGVRV